MNIYKTLVTKIGAEAKLFHANQMIILFGDNAPEDLANYTYTIGLEPLSEEIVAGQIFKIDQIEYQITAVGNLVTKNLSGLGHITVKFDGATEASLPGTLHLEAKEIPEIKPGSSIQIIA